MNKRVLEPRRGGGFEDDFRNDLSAHMNIPSIGNEHCFNY